MMATTQKVRDNAYMGLYKAVCKYVSLQGGKVVMCNGIQVQEWPLLRNGSFSIAVKCLGRKPKFSEQREAEGAAEKP